MHHLERGTRSECVNLHRSRGEVGQSEPDPKVCAELANESSSANLASCSFSVASPLCTAGPGGSAASLITHLINAALVRLHHHLTDTLLPSLVVWPDRLDRLSFQPFAWLALGEKVTTAMRRRGATEFVADTEQKVHTGVSYCCQTKTGLILIRCLCSDTADQWTIPLRLSVLPKWEDD